MEQKKQYKQRPKIEFSEEEMRRIVEEANYRAEMNRQYREDLEYREKRIRETMERILQKHNSTGY